jgi:tetratricopeptide (TPR) repeat protein
MRAFAAVPIAIALCVAPPAFAAPRASVTSARKAERRGEWRKALRHWKAAYGKEPNAEYLIGIGDAYAHLGNSSEARKNYEAYLADPLAMASRIEKVKARLANLQPDAVAVPAPLPLPSLSAVPAADSKKDADPPLPLPARDRPAAAQAAPVQVSALPTKIEFPPATPKESTPAAAAESPTLPPKPILVVATPAAAPLAAVSRAPFPPQPKAESSRAQRTMAYVTAGVAIAALGGGALAWTQAGSAHSALTSKIHTGAETQLLLEDERRNRTLSLIGFAGGLLAAGIATALFAF